MPMLPHLDPEHIIALHCPLCPFLTLSVTRLFEHCITHDSPCECTLLQCADCGRVTTHEGLMREHVLALHSKQQLTDESQSPPSMNQQPKLPIKRLLFISLNSNSSSAMSLGQQSGESIETSLASLADEQERDVETQCPCLFCEERLPDLPSLELHCDNVHGLRQISVKTVHQRLRHMVAKALLGTPSGALAVANTAVTSANVPESKANNSAVRQQPELPQQPQHFEQIEDMNQLRHASRRQQLLSSSVFPGCSIEQRNVRASVPLLQPAPSAAPLSKRVKLELLEQESPDQRMQQSPNYSLSADSSNVVSREADREDDEAVFDQPASSLLSMSSPPRQQRRQPSPQPLSASSLSFLTAPRTSTAPTVSSFSAISTAGGGGSIGRPSMQPLGLRLAELGGELLEDQAPYSTRCTYCHRVVRLSSRSCTNFKIHRQRCQENMANLAAPPGQASWPPKAANAAIAEGGVKSGCARDRADSVSD